MRRTLPALVVLLSILVLATRVDVDFDRIRIRVPVGTPPVDGRASLDVPDLTRLAGAPAALVLHVQGGQAPGSLEVRFDGAVVARAEVGMRARTRIDAVVRPASRMRHSLQIAGTTTDWRLSEAEISSVHGYVRGLVSLSVVPAERGPDWPVSPWLIVPLAIGLLALRPREDGPARPVVRAFHRTAIGGVGVILLVVLVAHHVGPYGVLLGPQTWLLVLAIVYAGQIARLSHQFARRTLALAPRPASLLPHLLVAIFFLGGVASFYDRATGFTSFVMFGREFAEFRHPALHSMRLAEDRGYGYDGQFYAQLAIDPLLLDEETVGALDAPGYRARRPLVPALAYVAGLGHPWYAVQAYAVLNVVCWFVLGWLLLQWLGPGSARSAAAWAACMLSSGLLASVVLALVDGPSVVVLVLAVLAVERGRHASSAVALGLAILSRDSHVVGGGLLAAPERRWAWRPLAWHALLVVLPLALWLAYLWARGIDPLEAGQRNFAAPLAGFAGRWSQALAELDLTRKDSLLLSPLPTLVGLTVQAGVLLMRPAWRDAWWRLAIGYVVLLCVLGPSVWEGYPGAASRALLPMTIAFNILLLRGRWSWSLWFLGNLHVLDGVRLLLPWLGHLILIG